LRDLVALYIFWRKRLKYNSYGNVNKSPIMKLDMNVLDNLSVNVYMDQDTVLTVSILINLIEKKLVVIPLMLILVDYD